jgi:hypothetical protein
VFDLCLVATITLSLLTMGGFRYYYRNRDDLIFAQMKGRASALRKEAVAPIGKPSA